MGSTSLLGSNIIENNGQYFKDLIILIQMRMPFEELLEAAACKILIE